MEVARREQTGAGPAVLRHLRRAAQAGFERPARRSQRQAQSNRSGERSVAQAREIAGCWRDFTVTFQTHRGSRHAPAFSGSCAKKELRKAWWGGENYRDF